MKFLLTIILPNGVFRLRSYLRARKRRERVMMVARKGSSNGETAYTYNAAMDFLVDCGLNADQIKSVSMDEPSLLFCAAALQKLEIQEAVYGLHIGNAVGMSLAYFSHVVQELHPDSIMASIDPNIHHEGVDNPLSKVIALLNHFGFQNRNLILTGYTLEKNISSDGHVSGSYDPVVEVEHEHSCENQLDILDRMGGFKFHFCVIDGNHDPVYLRREIDSVDRLLKPGGILILDDVSRRWRDLQRVYQSIEPSKYDDLGTDGRVGILRKKG